MGPDFYFCIPLISKHSSHDWAAVCTNLRRTLANLMAQSDQKFRIMIAGHDRPDFLLDAPLLAAKVEFVSVADMFPPPDAITEFGTDKGRKKRVMGQRLRELGVTDTYVMFLDADDLLYTGLVAMVREKNNKRGYYFQNGYLFDVKNQILGLMQDSTKPFYTYCGSSSIIYFTLNDFPRHREDRRCYFSEFRNHTKFVEIAEHFGRPLDPIECPAVIYVLNHGENVQQFEGKLFRKTARAKKYMVAQNEEVHKYDSAFPGLSSCIVISSA